MFDEDELLQRASTQAVEDTDTGQPSIAAAASHLKSVVERLFEVDENGVGEYEYAYYVHVYVYKDNICTCINIISNAFLSYSTEHQFRENSCNILLLLFIV